MSNTPKELKYTKSHEWVRREADGSVTVGITDHAQHLLGDLVFIELPEVGRELTAGEECSVVESVKAASDVYAPIAGTVTATNGDAESTPEVVNTDAYGKGWLFRMTPASSSDIDGLLDAAAYDAVVASEAH